MRAIRFLLGLLISALFIWLALRQVKDWNTFLASFQEINYWFLIPTLLGYILVLLARAWRWQYILNSQSRVKFSSSLSGIFICYMANNLLPLRAGELIRAFALARREKLSFSPVMASVVVERIFDSIAILFFLALVMLKLDISPQHQDLNQAIHKGGFAALILALFLVIALYILYFWDEQIEKLTERLLSPLGRKIRETGLSELKKFIHGLKILGEPTRLVGVLILSFLVWLVNLTPIWMVGLGFGLKLGFIQGLFLLVLGAFAASIPAAPGFWGTFHLITQKGIAFLGILSPNQALSFAIVLHSFYFFPTTLVGLFLVWREGYSLAELTRKAESGGNPEES